MTLWGDWMKKSLAQSTGPTNRMNSLLNDSVNLMELTKRRNRRLLRGCFPHIQWQINNDSIDSEDDDSINRFPLYIRPPFDLDVVHRLLRTAVEFIMEERSHEFSPFIDTNTIKLCNELSSWVRDRIKKLEYDR